MRKSLIVWLCAWMLLCGIIPCHAAVTTQFETTILRPDGTPAAAANVLVRILRDEDGSLLEDRELIADEQGHVSTAIEFERLPHPLNSVLYALIDVPDCALTLVNIPIVSTAVKGAPAFLSVQEQGRRDVPNPLKLRAPYLLKGVVLDNNKQPVAGADVVITTRTGVGFAAPARYNFPSAKIYTPSMRTTTDVHGHFALRGVDVAGASNKGGLFNVVAMAQQNEQLLVGSTVMNFNLPADRLSEAHITLAPTMPLHGTVVDAITNQPVKDAQVSLAAAPGSRNYYVIPYLTAKTGADGVYHFAGVPAIDELVAKVNAPGYGMGRIIINESGITRLVDGAKDYRVALRPMIQAKGRIKNAVTGKAVFGPPLSLIACYDEGYRGLNMRLNGHSVEVPVAPDGTFTLTVPTGESRFQVALASELRGTGLGPGFVGKQAFFTAQPATVNVTDGNELAITVQPPDVLYLLLLAKQPPIGVPVVIVRAGEKSYQCYPSKGLYALPCKLGQPLTFRVEVKQQIILPWTTIQTNPEVWLHAEKIQ